MKKMARKEIRFNADDELQVKLDFLAKVLKIKKPTKLLQFLINDKYQEIIRISNLNSIKIDSPQPKTNSQEVSL